MLVVLKMNPHSPTPFLSPRKKSIPYFFLFFSLFSYQNCMNMKIIILLFYFREIFHHHQSEASTRHFINNAWDAKEIIMCNINEAQQFFFLFLLFLLFSFCFCFVLLHVVVFLSALLHYAIENRVSELEKLRKKGDGGKEERNESGFEGFRLRVISPRFLDVTSGLAFGYPWNSVSNLKF